MIIAIHQPQYMPWLGYFDKMLRSDVFVFLDTVQYIKNEFKNRNKILTAQGPVWLTVPVNYSFGQNINEIKAVDSHWQEKHRKTLQLVYGKAPFFKDLFPEFERYYSTSSPRDSSPRDSSPRDSSPRDSSPRDSSPRVLSPRNRITCNATPEGRELAPRSDGAERRSINTAITGTGHEMLCEAALDSIYLLCRLLGIKKNFYIASSFEGLSNDPTGRLVDIVKRLNGNTYVSGPDGRKYLDAAQFEKAGIKLLFHQYEHPKYPQHNSEAFVPFMSALDLLFNCGEKSREILDCGKAIE